MATPTFNLTAEALRKSLVVYVDVSETEGTPEWEPQGYKTEEMSMEFNPDSETITDILGDTYTTVNKLERAMSFAPNTLRPIANRGKLNQILHEYTRRNELSRLSNFKVLIAYGYTTDLDADMYPACTIIPQSLGGASRVEFPYDIQLGGEAVYGKVDKLLPVPQFTPEVVV